MTLETQRIIWRALLASLALYGTFPWFIRLERSAESLDPLFLRMIMGVAFCIGIGSLAARQVLLVRPIRAGELIPNTDAGLARVGRISIVLWALSEAVGLYGLMLYMLSGEARHLYLFLMAATGLFFAHRPGRLPASGQQRSG